MTTLTLEVDTVLNPYQKKALLAALEAGGTFANVRLTSTSEAMTEGQFLVYSAFDFSVLDALGEDATDDSTFVAADLVAARQRAVTTAAEQAEVTLLSFDID